VAQPILHASVARNALSLFNPAQAPAAAAPPSVSVRTQQPPTFLSVGKVCGEPDDIHELFNLHQSQQIHVMNLASSDMRGMMWTYLMEHLDKLPALITLNLTGCQIGRRPDITLTIFGEFMAGLKEMPFNLILRRCFINSRCITPIAERLKVDRNLQTLDLAENCLSSTDIQFVVDALRHNRTLSSLNLSNNKLDTESVPALAKLLTNARSLEKLNLSANAFSTADKAALQQANAARASAPIELML